MSTVSRGLQAKVITEKKIKNKCPICNGTGVIKHGEIAVSQIKNLKNKGLNLDASLEVSDDCSHCNGTGHVSSTIKFARKSKSSPVIRVSSL